LSAADCGAAKVMSGVLLEILAEICPATADADHDALTVLAYTADEELDRRFAVGAREVVNLDLLVAALMAETGVAPICRS
jgi:hypothetical protein